MNLIAILEDDEAFFEHLARVSLLCVADGLGRDVAAWLAARPGVSPVDDLAWIRRAWIREVRQTVGMA